MKALIAAVCSGLLLAVAGAVSAEPVATVVAVRGKANVERGDKNLIAQSKLGIELRDKVSTAVGGRVKLLFIDDSVLTLAEKSSMSVDTFVHSRSDRGKSLFNLLDGKMRAVVGKTRFEVKTPTVVAAARGTVILFDVGSINGKSFTRVTCLEGIVDVRSVTAAPGTKPVMLSPGQSIVVTAKQPPPSEQKSKSEKSSKTEPNSKQEQSQPASTQASSPDPASTTSSTSSTPTSSPVPEPASSSIMSPTPITEQQLPLPEQLSPGELDKLKKATDTSGAEIKLPPPPLPVPPPPPPVIPQIQQQPAKRQPTKVDIGVKF